MISFVHERIKKRKYDHGIDFTMGNGHDTLFLSQYCQHVYSYDIQDQALKNTQKLMAGTNNVSLYLKSHEFFDEDVVETLFVDVTFELTSMFIIHSPVSVIVPEVPVLPLLLLSV